jgi:hypothetical protein
MLGNAAGLAAGAAAFLGQSAKFVQLHPESIKAIHRDDLISGTDGFFRMMTRGADKKFVSQLQWKKTNVNPARMMSLQMVAVQLALKTAIAEVEESVQRVEGKVEEVLRLAHANRSGDVLGDRVTIDRMVAYLDRHGGFSDADWDSIAGVGPALNRTVEQLRHHADRTLRSFDSTRPIQDRADFIVKAVEADQLGETLSLLVVAQESLFKWQRLRLARVEATQTEHVQQVLDDARFSEPRTVSRPSRRPSRSTDSGSGLFRGYSATFPSSAPTSTGSPRHGAPICRSGRTSRPPRRWRPHLPRWTGSATPPPSRLVQRPKGLTV